MLTIEINNSPDIFGYKIITVSHNKNIIKELEGPNFNEIFIHLPDLLRHVYNLGLQDGKSVDYNNGA